MGAVMDASGADAAPLPAAGAAPQRCCLTGGIEALPHELLAQIFLQLDAAPDAAALVGSCRAAAHAWAACARAPWVRRRAAAASFARACAADDAAAAAHLLATGWPGAEADAAAAIARHTRTGQLSAVRAVIDWAAAAAPSLLAPPGDGPRNGPLVLATAAGRTSLACHVVSALLRLGRREGAAQSCRATQPQQWQQGQQPAPQLLWRDVQFQLDRALRAAAAGGHTAIIARLATAGARADSAGDGLDCGACCVAVLHGHPEAVAALLAWPAAAGGPTREQAAAAAAIAAGCGLASCLVPLLRAGGLDGAALGAALAAAARAGQAECAALLVSALRRGVAPAAELAREERALAALTDAAAADGGAVCVVRISAPGGGAPPVAKAGGAEEGGLAAALREALALAPASGRAAALLAEELARAPTAAAPGSWGAPLPPAVANRRRGGFWYQLGAALLA
ncbi:hypothetical protein Rsub_08615 [Raphidocelis subcapitata]|uniref:F-box domain-containing protein n=1 Tax=Raphidocelis subcapitata TaxID=307507 RepID=A0A2V0PCK4_9CHLO|nr:hypothetical protein Rsub_08615 [Raphidocelis subcapitata]|eukprot:GBF95633.1 hypothetical protein Rsub_08615 [Raphidocelis subcapitata]